jgi:hypothetical protein
MQVFGIALVEAIAATRRITTGASADRPQPTRGRRVRHDGE